MLILTPLVFSSFLYQGYELPKWFLLRWGMFLIFAALATSIPPPLRGRLGRGEGKSKRSATLQGRLETSEAKASHYVASARKDGSLSIPRPFFLYPLAAFLFFKLLSLGQAVNICQGILNISNLVLGLAVFFYAAVFLKEDKPGRLMFLLVLPALPVALYGIGQMFGLDFVHLPDAFRGAVSVFGHRNFAAEYLVMAIPAALCLIFTATSGRKVRWLAAAVLAAAYAHLIFTHTRAAYLGLFAGLFAVLALVWLDKKNRNGRKALIFTLAGLCLATMFFLTVFFRFLGERPVVFSAGTNTADAARGAAGGEAVPSSVQSRLLIWQAAFTAFQKHPFLGCGAGNLEEVLPLYHSDVLKKRFRGRIEAGTVHNEYLEVLAETGAPGAFFFLAFVACLLFFGASVSRRGLREGDLRPVFLFAGLVAILVDSFASSPLQRPATVFLFWLYAGLLVRTSADGWFVVKSRASSVTTAGVFSDRSVKHLILGLAAVSGIFAYVFGWQPLLADYHGSRSIRTYLAGNVQEAVSEIEAAVAFQPQSRHLLTMAGNTCLRAGQIEKAAQHYSRVVIYHPYWPQGYGNLAMALAQAGLFSDAETNYRISLRMDNYQPVVHNGLAAVYIQTGRFPEARQELVLALELDPGFDYARLNLEELDKRMGTK